MIELIKDYTKDKPAQREARTEAARQWRFPYWDWSVEGGDVDNSVNYNIPRLIRLYEVKVEAPEGWKFVRSPFYNFKLPGGWVFGNGPDPDKSKKEDRLGEYAISLPPVSNLYL